MARTNILGAGVDPMYTLWFYFQISTESWTQTKLKFLTDFLVQQQQTRRPITMNFWWMLNDARFFKKPWLETEFPPKCHFRIIIPRLQQQPLLPTRAPGSATIQGHPNSWNFTREGHRIEDTSDTSKPKWPSQVVSEWFVVARKISQMSTNIGGYFT